MNTIPQKRQDVLKWNGWGYKNCGFVLNQDEIVEFSGERYGVGRVELPDWLVEKMALDFSKTTQSVPFPNSDSFPEPKIPEDCMRELQNSGISFSLDGAERMIRSHGQTLEEIYAVRNGKFPRIPDVVIWVRSHVDVVKIVELAKTHQIVVIPFGGGTNVSGAVLCPQTEMRPIISLDTSQMNKLLWINKENLTCCAEAGIIGQDLEAQLKESGFTSGHEPDSYEFSSLGGWVATRASGMKKSTYGNIEDILIHVKMVTPRGVIEKHCQAPRMSAGPDIHHFILGSEGSLGVITEAVLKIRPLPSCRKFGSIVFPDFQSGVQCLREIALQRCHPTSIRLLDNEQFRLGMALQAKSDLSLIQRIGRQAKQFLLTWYKGYDLNELSVATLLFEGTFEEVEVCEKRVLSIAKKFGGLDSGAESGERGYLLTFIIAYLRDFALNLYQVAESFETSVPWSHVTALCENVKKRVAQECRGRGINYFLISCRVTQSYDAGCCVYFYLCFNYSGIQDPVHAFEEIESAARDEILANSGSISHHHGIGKIRKQFIPKTMSESAIGTLRSLKLAIDPQNIFGNGNMLGNTTESDPFRVKSKL